jgi:hypothetical protein
VLSGGWYNPLDNLEDVDEAARAKELLTGGDRQNGGRPLDHDAAGEFGAGG